MPFYLVGEQGPELFRPDESGRIIRPDDSNPPSQPPPA